MDFKIELRRTRKLRGVHFRKSNAVVTFPVAARDEGASSDFQCPAETDF
jgi:hypothetical protein